MNEVVFEKFAAKITTESHRRSEWWELASRFNDHDKTNWMHVIHLNWTFTRQDEAAIYTSIKTKHSQLMDNISVIHRNYHDPDLRFIENVDNLLARKVKTEEIDVQPKTKLWEATVWTKVWLYWNWVNSMQKLSICCVWYTSMLSFISIAQLSFGRVVLWVLCTRYSYFWLAKREISDYLDQCKIAHFELVPLIRFTFQWARG